MPDTAGLDAITALRAAGVGIPVISVTARGGVSGRIHGLSLSAVTTGTLHATQCFIPIAAMA